LTKNWKIERGTFNLSGHSGIDRNESGYQNRGFERYYDLAGRLSYQFTRRLSGNFGAALRRNEFINDQNGETENRAIFNAGLNYKPKRWMSVFSNYSHSFLISSDKSSLVDSNGNTLGNGSGTVDNYWNFDAGATFIPRPWLFVTLKYSHMNLTSDLASENSEENRASLTVTLVPEHPYRKVF
jgi:hypothetical protein